MTATWINPETRKPMPVFVHEAIEENGKSLLLVNKGCTKTFATFRVRSACGRGVFWNCRFA